MGKQENQSGPGLVEENTDYHKNNFLIVYRQFFLWQIIPHVQLIMITFSPQEDWKTYA